ncbi:MAG TPA: hypothetical protein VNZ52_14765, partial [Candidatus Thermoplasmatota archaeon]|nr:hypothetical protein [Candidatus Thermoplasmatota archaeon]
MSGLDRTGALVLGFLLLVALAASPAGAQVALDTYKEHETRLPPGAAATVLAEVPFHLDQDGSVYAKLLPTPWNAVNDGIPNGTVNANHTEGLTGWHIRYVLTDENGVPLTVDGKGNPVSADLGVYADATPTKPVFLKAGTPYRFLGIITVPEEAARPGVTSKVVFALVF